jgi:hypothetical protein
MQFTGYMLEHFTLWAYLRSFQPFRGPCFFWKHGMLFGGRGDSPCHVVPVVCLLAVLPVKTNTLFWVDGLQNERKVNGTPDPGRDVTLGMQCPCMCSAASNAGSCASVLQRGRCA